MPSSDVGRRTIIETLFASKSASETGVEYVTVGELLDGTGATLADIEYLRSLGWIARNPNVLAHAGWPDPRAEFIILTADGLKEADSLRGNPPPPDPSASNSDEPKVPQRVMKAWQQYRQAAEALGTGEPTDRAAYDQLTRAYRLAGEGDGLPDFSTWTRYLREYRKLMKLQKHQPRQGRSGRSVRHSSEL